MSTDTVYLIILLVLLFAGIITAIAVSMYYYRLEHNDDSKIDEDDSEVV